MHLIAVFKCIVKGMCISIRRHIGQIVMATWKTFWIFKETMQKVLSGRI